MTLSSKVVRGWDRAVHAAARVGYGLPLGQPERWGVTLHRNVPYLPTGKRSHWLDVYVPPGRGPHPTVMYVHGGGFAVLSKDTHRIMALGFASRGCAVFNINYRLGPRHRYPAPIEDASAALLWVKRHGAKFGADPNRISLAGESAGANLVAALAFACTHERPEPFAKRLFESDLKLRSVLPIYGLHDLNDLDRFDHPKLSRALKMAIHRAAAAYVGRPVRQRAPMAPMASPLRLYERSPAGPREQPPFFLACGTADPLLPDTKRLAEALRRRGATVETSIHPGEIHGFNAMIWRREARAKWKAVSEFLDRHA